MRPLWCEIASQVAFAYIFPVCHPPPSCTRRMTQSNPPARAPARPGPGPARAQHGRRSCHGHGPWPMAMAMGLGPALGPAWPEAMPLSHGHVPMVPWTWIHFPRLQAPSGGCGGALPAKSTQPMKTNPGPNRSPFSAPGGKSRHSKAGFLHRTAVRTLWDYSRGPKPTIISQIL